MTIRWVLGRPSAFRAFKRLIGAARASEILVREHVRPRAGQRLLDIGCGTGEIVPFLAGVDYVGFDENPEYVRAARARYPGARFSCERIDAHVANDESFDLALAFGVLHHLNDVEAGELLRLAYSSLRPGGRLITLDGCYVDGQNRVARWLLSSDRGRYVRSRDEYLRLMRGVFHDINPVLRADLLRVPYTHLIVECARA